jgi:hypothetical protein
MNYGKAIIGIGLWALIFFLFLKAGEAQAATFYGKIVAIEGNALQVLSFLHLIPFLVIHIR